MLLIVHWRSCHPISKVERSGYGVEILCRIRLRSHGVLAPWAFIIYTNDLLIEMNDQYVLSIGYADDTCFLVNFTSEVDRGVIEKLLVRIQRWSVRNGLLLNTRKCRCMIFGNQLEKPMTPVRVHSCDAHDETCSCPEVSCVWRQNISVRFLTIG